MKLVKYILILYLLVTGNVAYSQNKNVAADITITFKVFGACDQCKDRIERAVKGKGVKTVWDVDTKELLLVYNFNTEV